MPRAVICNTSAVFYLHRLQGLALLKELYGTIVVPQTVVAELEEGRKVGEDVPDLADHPWIEVRPVPRIIRLLTDLGPGEAGVLALASEEAGALVILDDSLARRTADAQNIKATGTLGVLLKAKQEGHISEVGPLVEQLLELGFRLSTRLHRDILELAGELGEGD